MPGDLQIEQTLVFPPDEFNCKLVENAHPANWKNPTPKGRYNLVVVGGGTAGLVSAVGAAGLGARVALIERHLMGGDCLNCGCVPSKALLRVSRAAREVREAALFGIKTNGSVSVDFAQAMERVRRLRAAISEHDSVARMASLGIDVFLGSACFAGEDAIEVDGCRLTFSKAVIATGTRAAVLPLPGLEEAGYLTNETVFSLTVAPQRLLVVGAGPIGCEISQAFQRLGSQVTLLNDERRILPREDSDAASLLASRFQSEGMRLILGARIHHVERTPTGKVLLFEHEGQEGRIEGDEILVAIGRVPNIENLGLKAAAVEYDKNGVRVDDNLRTSNHNIYGAGDICSNFKYTHVADAMARIVIQNALFLGRKRMSDLVIPWCTYTDPEIAHVGLYESEARRAGYDVMTLTVSLAEMDRAIIDGETEGIARMHCDKKTGRILGATLVASHAGEMIGELVLAMSKRVSVGTLSAVIHPYPTQAEVLKRVGDLYMRSRLKQWMRPVIAKYLSWRR